jgi:hypothetical protein
MQNEFNTLAREFATGHAVQYFGERDNSGRLIVITATEPGGRERAIVGAMIGGLKISDEIADEHGTHVRDQIEDVIELTIPTAQAFGEYQPKTETKLAIPTIGGERFTVLEVLSGGGTHAVRVRATRKHITRIQRTGTERN